MFRNLLLVLACSLAVAAYAQPTWRFPIAFEDGTGARDTIWMVYDTTATLDISPWPNPSVDTLLGEVKVEIDTTVFNVWMYNAVNDSTKTRAYPYSVFPSFDGTTIDAINWTPPMTITWDTSLFHAPYLPYAQGHFGIAVLNGLAFSQFDQGQAFGLYNMLIDNHVTIDFLSEYLFPFAVYFDAVDHTGIHDHGTAETAVQIWPNPATTEVSVQGYPGQDCTLRIMDASGRAVIKELHFNGTATMSVVGIDPGLYMCLIISEQGHTWSGRLVIGR